ncbi:MAG: glutamate-5-semialdehyde dehydrogenase [Actinomycetota bacterium]
MPAEPALPLAEIGARAKSASGMLARSSSQNRRDALHAMATALSTAGESILETNKRDIQTAEAGGLKGALVDRLALTQKRVEQMAEGLRAVAEQPDPLGRVLGEWVRPNGLKIQKVSVPIGVICVIYEARPNVTADVAGLCLMSGNAIILRGSSHALQSNMAIAEVLRGAIVEAGLPRDAIQLVKDISRDSATELMRLNQFIDLIIPRGGPALIQSIRDNANVPFIIDGDGNCHLYVDKAADKDMAVSIVVNAKTQRPGVCNAAETLLVHAELVKDWLPWALESLAEKGVEIRGDATVCGVWPKAVPATEDDWGTEYLDLKLAVRVVDSLDAAIEHVNKWGTSNAEAIVTEDSEAAVRFAQEVDSGSIFVNASTRFSDGGEFGYGSEIGISTQKLHARGPMGLNELTTFKYVVWGTGQIRT